MSPLGLGANPLDPVRKVLRGGRERVEKVSSDIRSLADEIRGIADLGHQSPPSAPGSQQEPPPPQDTISNTSVSKLTNDEVLAYQNREIGRELWQLEKHLSQGCRIPDKTGERIPCDCCDKGSFIAGLAYESIPIAEREGKPSDIYARIARWTEELEPMVKVPAVESGQYDYKKLAGEASMLRKGLMGTSSFSALTAPKEKKSYEERAKAIGDRLNVNWNKIDLDEFTVGIKVEMEHADVTGGDIETTAKIALAHLAEVPDYYTKLTRYVEPGVMS